MDVCRAAAPLPALLLVVETLFVLVAAAASQAALGAGRGNRVGDPGCNNCVGERGLLAACDKDERRFFNHNCQQRDSLFQTLSSLLTYLA